MNASDPSKPPLRGRRAIHRVSWKPLLTLIALAGCSNNGLVTVTGVVTLDGQPLPGATVAFTPTGPGIPARAVSGADGRFVMTSGGRGKGARPGDYSVTILKLESRLVSPQEARTLKPGPDREIDRVARDDDAVTVIEYLVPKRYASAGSSGLSARVPGTGAEVRFDLKREPDR